MMDQHRKLWNDQHKTLQQILLRPEEHARAIELFLQQHAMVHAPEMALPGQPGSGQWSFDEEVWQGLAEADARRVPPKDEHSIAWMIWHIARIEDITMNLLVAGCPQLATSEDWLARMHAPVRDTASAMTAEEIVRLSDALDISALREYRVAVGRRTREIVRQLCPGDLKKKPAPERLQQILDEGAVVPEARWLVDYWGGRTSGGLLMMPATRHPFVHLNEALRLKP